MTLACEDANSKLVDTVADIEAEARVGKVCWRFESRGLVIKHNFCSDFQYKVLSRF